MADVNAVLHELETEMARRGMTASAVREERNYGAPHGSTFLRQVHTEASDDPRADASRLANLVQASTVRPTFYDLAVPEGVRSASRASSEAASVRFVAVHMVAIDAEVRRYDVLFA